MGVVYNNWKWRNVIESVEIYFWTKWMCDEEQSDDISVRNKEIILRKHGKC